MSYLGKTPSQAVRQRYIFTASGGETSISGADDNGNTLTYTDGAYADVYLNGVLLVAGTDYNTSTVNTIGGLTALSASDVVEIVVYDTFAVFGGEVQGDLSVSNGGFTATQDSTNPVTINRTTSDGTIIDLQKNGTTVGSIGASVGDLYIGTGEHGLKFVDASTDIRPFNTSTGASSDATTDLGNSTSRFKDLYLSGGVYLGGTGAANYLDDYEEGEVTVTAEPRTSGTITLLSSWEKLAYTKVGRKVTVTGEIRIDSVSSPVGSYIEIHDLPFVCANLGDAAGRAHGATYHYDSANVGTLPYRIRENENFLIVQLDASTAVSGMEFGFNATYFTN